MATGELFKITLAVLGGAGALITILQGTYRAFNEDISGWGVLLITAMALAIIVLSIMVYYNHHRIKQLRGESS